MLLVSGSYSVFSDGWNGAGIYMASGISPSASFDPPIYIGSAKDLRKRIAYKHLPELACGEHHNSPMRNYVMKNGIESLIWICLEVCEKDQLLIREQFYLDYFTPFAISGKGFNVLPNAGSSFGNLHAEETKRKMRDSHLKRWDDMPGEKAAFISPQGEIIQIDNLRKFCEENKLHIANMRRVQRGSATHHHGWRKIKENKSLTISAALSASTHPTDDSAAENF